VNWGQEVFCRTGESDPSRAVAGQALIGIDYAVARGQRMEEGIGVTATISTGMIGLWK